MQTISNHVPADATSIFDAYRMILKDDVFTGRVESEIRNGYVIPVALKLSIEHFSAMFEAMDDPYLRSRHEDIRHLGNKLYRTWLNYQDCNQDDSENTSVILIGEALSVSDIASLPISKLAGIVCFDGSMLSHIAILANALGIPCVVGVGKVTDIRGGEKLIVDGDLAQLIRKPTHLVVDEYEHLLVNQKEHEQSLGALRELPATTIDGVRIELFANTGLQEDLKPGIANGAEGIGLYRTEIPFMIRQSLPSEEEQAAVYRKVFDCYPNAPVYIRTLDLGADKALPYLPYRSEDNPALGLRGVRFTLDSVQLLVTQIRAILRAGENRNEVNILFPMVSSTSEVDDVLGITNEAVERLNEEGYKIMAPRIGIMVEVPAVISLLTFWKEKIDFVSIGTNDLSQYLLAIDRNNPAVAGLYDSLHPSVLREIKRVIDWGEDADVPVSVCGEMAGDPASAVLLLAMGASKLSMSSSRIPVIKSMIRQLSLSDAKALLEISMTFDNPQSIRAASISMLEEIGFQYLSRNIK